MAIQPTVATLAVLFAAAFAPSLIYMTWIKNEEKFAHEPMSILIVIFVFCAVVSVIISYVLETVLTAAFVRFQGTSPSILEALVPTIAIAPIVEEGVNPIGVFLLRNIKSFVHPFDGTIYGATSGLGFAATENLLYEVSALIKYGFSAAILTVSLRAVSSTLIHGSATGLTGYGIGKWKFGASSVTIPLYYLGAVLLHGLFNLIATVGNLPLALVIAITSFLIMIFYGVRVSQ